MLIRCKLFRAGGTRVELGKGKDARRYHFKPARPTGPDDKFDDPDIEHVCNVTNAEDVATFVAIRDGYEIHSSELDKPTAAAIAKDAEDKGQAEANAAAKQGAERTAATRAKGYKRMNKPDLIKLIAERTGKAPHGTTPVGKLIETLEKLDAQPA